MKYVEQSTTQPRTRPQTIKEMVFNAIRDAPDGLTAGELYNTLPQLNPRQIRLATQDMKSERKVSNARKCRCHSSSIYEVIVL